MVDMNELRASVLEVIKDNEINENALKEILKPISTHFGNKIFLEHAERVIQIIVEDRDGNNKFDVNDLKCLSKDILATTSLITALLLILGSIPNINLLYSVDATEEVVFKFLIFIFIILIPKKTGHDWSYDEKKSIIDLILVIYQLIRSSQVTKNLLTKVRDWFKSKGWCKWCTTLPEEEHKMNVFEDKLPKVGLKLKGHLHNMRDREAARRGLQ